MSSQRLLLAAAILLLPVAPARADWPFPFVQITCAPELHYVAVRRMIVENAAGYGDLDHPYGWAANQKQSEARNGIFTSRSLADHPVTCDMPAKTTAIDEDREPISVTIGAKIDPPPKDERREAADEVTVDSGRHRLAEIWMDLRGHKAGVDSLELYANGVGTTLRTCAFDPGSDDKLACTSKNLPPVAQR
jgi:hypothetical protein